MSIVALISDATTIAAGQSITYNIAFTPPLQLLIPVSGDEYYQFGTIWATLLSGDGQNQFFQGDSITFTYLTPGEYTASVNGTAYYRPVTCSIPPLCDPEPCCGVPLVGFAATEHITVSVPEPATAALMAIALAVMMFRSIPNRPHIFPRRRSRA